MLNLNLLPPEIKDEIAFSKKNARIVKYLGFSVSGLLIIFALFVGLTVAINNKQQVYQIQKSSAERILAQSKDLQTRANDLSDRLKLIKKLKAARKDWPAIFKALSDNTPSGVQLDSIDLSAVDKTRAKITGLAKSDRDVVLFKDLLTNSKVFKYVDIENIGEGSDPTGRGLPTKTFMISLSLSGVSK